MANRFRNDGDDALDELMDSMANNHEARKHIQNAMQSLGLACFELGRQEQHIRSGATHAERASKALARLPVGA